MTSTFLFLSAAVALGADAPAPMPVAAAPAPVAAAPAPLVVSGTGCSGCGAPAVAWASPVCDPCAPRAGLFDRLRARWEARPRLFGNNNCEPACVPAPVATCAPAPVACPPAPVACGQPLFTGFTTSCADPCERVGLLARLRARFASGRSCDAHAAPLASACCGSSVAGLPATGCTSGYGTVLTAPSTAAPAAGPTTAPPDKMPTPMPKKDEPKKDEPKKELSIQAPVLSVPAVEVPRVPTLGGTNGKY